MIYTDLTRKAIVYAYNAHEGQFDRGGIPYIFHPYHLAEQMTDELTACAALLHDVMEDTATTADDLRKEGFPEEVIEAVTLLTHDEDIAYMDYVAKLSKNKIAKTVKLADLAHNSDITRTPANTEPAEKTAERIKKYAAAREFLLNSD